MARLKKDIQIKLMKEISRLNRAGIRQKWIAEQLIKYGGGKIREVGVECRNMLSVGKDFSIGLQPFLSEQAYLVLLNGTKAGDFQRGIDDAVRALEMEEQSSGALVKALIKPISFMIFSCLASALIASKVFPAMEALLPQKKWGEITLFAHGFGMFFANYGVYVLIFFLVLSVSIGLSLRRFWSWRCYIDGWPIFRQYRFIQCTNFLSSIAYQLSIGVQLKQALTRYKDSCSPYLSHHIALMLTQIKKGKSSIGDIFDTKLIINSEMDAMKRLSNSGDVSLTLMHCSQMHSEKLIWEINIFKSWGKNLGLSIGVVIVSIQILGLLSLIFNLIFNLFSKL